MTKALDLLARFIFTQGRPYNQIMVHAIQLIVLIIFFVGIELLLDSYDLSEHVTPSLAIASARFVSNKL